MIDYAIIEADKKACDYIKANRQQQQHEAWQRYVASLTPIEDLDKFFQDPEAMIELRTYPVAKLINSQFELKQFLLRFGDWNSYGDDYNRVFYNTECLDYFSYYITVDEEIEGGLENAPCKVLTRNVKLKDDDPDLAYLKSFCSGYLPDDISLTDEAEEIKYPCIVAVPFGDGLHSDEDNRLIIIPERVGNGTIISI